VRRSTNVFGRIPKDELFGRLGLVAPLRLARLGDPVERPSIRHVVVPAPAREQLPGDEATTIEEVAATPSGPGTFFRDFLAKEEVVFWSEYRPMLAGLVAERPDDEPTMRRSDTGAGPIARPNAARQTPRG
jgi:hypothetical protein